MRLADRYIPRLQDELATAQEEAAKELAAAIQARAPRHTGEYADSIVAAKLDGRNADLKQVGINPTKDKNAWGIFALYIWRFLEFGTKASPARPSRRNFSFRRLFVSTKAYRAHAATPAIPHIFPTYRAMRKTIRRKITQAINRATKQARKGF